MSDPFFREVESLPQQFLWKPDPQGTLDPGAVVYAGMGGSALAAEIAGRGRGGAQPWRVSREEGLPGDAPTDSRVVCVSFSGNTRETLRAWDEAERRGWSRAAVASGGKLLERARNQGQPWVQVPGTFSPRSSLGYLVKGCMSVCPPEVEPDWAGAAAHLKQVAEFWRGQAAPDLSAPGGWVVVGPEAQRTAIRRWEADFTENAKTSLWPWVFPEASHNALMIMAPESRQAAPAFYALESSDARNHRAWLGFLKLLEERGAVVHRVHHPHADPWIELLGLAHAGDWRSVQHAEALGVPASSLSLLDEFKRRRDDPV